MSKIGGSGLGSKLLSDLRDIQLEMREISSPPKPVEAKTTGKASFVDYLKDSIKDVNEIQKNADKAAVDLASGKNENIHETMLKAAQAELSFNFMVQIRNKVLEAYQEIMRMPV
jgi:flagellar hook-basal body complex protein FliE